MWKTELFLEAEEKERSERCWGDLKRVVAASDRVGAPHRDILLMGKATCSACVMCGSSVALSNFRDLMNKPTAISMVLWT